ncbi:RNA polymerase sigma factor [Planctomycetota bacterium]
MSEQLDFMELAQRAQRGDKGALDRLAELAAKRLRVYVYRLTLQEDLAADIVQETMLEMCRVLGNLKRTDRFLPWLYGIATNKLRHYYRSEQTMKRATALKSDMERTDTSRHEGLESLVGQELKEIVTGAIQGLRTRHRAVLVMRCYDGMSYAEIAESMGTSEFGTRMLFMRAKKALQKQLSKQGLGRGTLMAALLLFGKMTAPSEVAAAEISIGAATLNAGLAASTAAIATSKAALVTVATAGALTIGSVAGPGLLDNQVADSRDVVTNDWHLSNANVDDKTVEKAWYYFPEGKDGPLILRAQTEAPGQAPDWIIMQNGEENYHFDGRTVAINNANWYARDWRVMRLPTDTTSMQSFLNKVEGATIDVPYVSVRGKGAFIGTMRGGDQNLAPELSYRDNVLAEDVFQPGWEISGSPEDRRDLMHKRGWTYFQVSGLLNEQLVRGAGCIPLNYEVSKQRVPWLELTVGDLKLSDSRQGAVVRRKSTQKQVRYQSGSFFKGLARPWTGLHTLDVIRRDAAVEELWFETKPRAGSKIATVEVSAGALVIFYEVDLKNDLLSRIRIQQNGRQIGDLSFLYLDRLPKSDTRSSSLGSRTSYKQGVQVSECWIADLASGDLVD